MAPRAIVEGAPVLKQRLEQFTAGVSERLAVALDPGGQTGSRARFRARARRERPVATGEHARERCQCLARLRSGGENSLAGILVVQDRRGLRPPRIRRGILRPESLVLEVGAQIALEPVEIRDLNAVIDRKRRSLHAYGIGSSRGQLKQRHGGARRAGAEGILAPPSHRPRSVQPGRPPTAKEPACPISSFRPAPAPRPATWQCLPARRGRPRSSCRSGGASMPISAQSVIASPPRDSTRSPPTCTAARPRPSRARPNRR